MSSACFAGASTGKKTRQPWHDNAIKLPWNNTYTFESSKCVLCLDVPFFLSLGSHSTIVQIDMVASCCRLCGPWAGISDPQKLGMNKTGSRSKTGSYLKDLVYCVLWKNWVWSSQAMGNLT